MTTPEPRDKARVGSNPQTTKPTLESKNEKRELLWCVLRVRVCCSLFIVPQGRYEVGAVCFKQVGRLM